MFCFIVLYFVLYYSIILCFIFYYFILSCFSMWCGHNIRIPYVGWQSCRESFCGLEGGGWRPLCKNSLCGVAIMYFILLLYVECPLQKDSLCGMAIMWGFFLWAGEWRPSCKDFLCGVAITSAFSMWSCHHVRILYVGWPCRDSLCVAASLGQPDLFCLVLYYILLISFDLFHFIVVEHSSGWAVHNNMCRRARGRGGLILFCLIHYCFILM